MKGPNRKGNATFVKITHMHVDDALACKKTYCTPAYSWLLSDQTFHFIHLLFLCLLGGMGKRIFLTTCQTIDALVLNPPGERIRK